MKRNLTYKVIGYCMTLSITIGILTGAILGLAVLLDWYIPLVWVRTLIPIMLLGMILFPAYFFLALSPRQLGNRDKAKEVKV